MEREHQNSKQDVGGDDVHTRTVRTRFKTRIMRDRSKTGAVSTQGYD